MEDPNVNQCVCCGEHMRAIPMDHRDGTITDSYECITPACSNGPAVLMTVRTINKQKRVESCTKFWSTSHFTHMAFGAPSVNEANVEGVARCVMAAWNRECGTQYDQFCPGPKDARHEAGHDCELASSHHARRLKLQITRAFPEKVYREQNRNGKRRVEGTIENAVEWIMQAARRKKHKASPDVVLVIDAIDAVPLGLFADVVIRASTSLQVELHEHRWLSVWLCGVAGARRLAGRDAL